MACIAPRLYQAGQQSRLCRHSCIAMYLGVLAALLACGAAQIIQTVEIVQGMALRQGHLRCRDQYEVATNTKVCAYNADTLPSFSTEVTDPKYIVAVDMRGPATEEGSESGSATKLSMRDSSGRLFTCLLPENVTGSDDAQDGLVSYILCHRLLILGASGSPSSGPLM